MSEEISSRKKNLMTSAKKNGAGVSSDLRVTLLNANETLVKKEEKSLVVRNKDGKLVRRKDADGVLDEVYKLIQEGEIFVREESGRIIVRNKDGKLVARKKPVAAAVPEPKVKTAQKIKEEKPVEEKAPEQNASTGDLKSRLLSKHAFLGRMERGEKIGVAPTSATTESSKNMQVVNSELVEEIEDDDIENIAPDSEVAALEDAVTEDKFNRTIGRYSSKGVRADSKTHIAGGAINPNEKPNLKGSATGDGLVGNYVLAKPETVGAPKKKKVKKQRKPANPWGVAVTLVGIYLIGMLTYFLVGYNFGDKKVSIMLYYIDIADTAKLEYYDGEQFVYSGMKLTYHYDDQTVETFNISGDDFAEVTVGMGYQLNKEYISALWIDNYADADFRKVKVKFVFDKLICYVPITIYRNRLIDVQKNFDLTSVAAGQELSPTLFGVYSNHLMEQKGETFEKQLALSEFDLVIGYSGQATTYSLKELGCFDGRKFVLPETIDHNLVDYTDSALEIKAVIPSDGYNAAKEIKLY